MSEKFLSFDRFSEPISLNFNKKASIPTYPGVFITVFLLTLTGIYGFQKWNKLRYRLQPTITVETTKNFFTSKDEVDLNESGFKIAFGVMDYDHRTTLQDPDFVRFQVFLEERKNLGIVRQTPLSYHICDQGDFDSFYPISINNKVFADELIQKKAMYCIDEGQHMVVRGADEIDSVALNIDFTTCDRTKGGKCAAMTKQDLLDYMGYPELIIMSNQQRFDNTVYDGSSIVSEAVIWNQHVDKRQTNWMLTFFDSLAVMDEIEYLDVGLVTPRPFSTYSLSQLGLSYSDNFEGYYKIAGFTVFRNLDYRVATRSVYDVLNFLGDVGGLEGILVIFGSWFISLFSGFASIGYYMQHLFYTTQRKQNSNNSSSDYSDGPRSDYQHKKHGGITRHGLYSKEEYNDDQMNVLKKDIKKSFDSQGFIRNPIFTRLILYWCFCRSWYRKYRKQHARASDQVENDFDLLRIIKLLRVHSIQLRTQLNVSQRRLSHKLAERAISCSESQSSVNEEDVPLNASPDVIEELRNQDFSARKYRYLDDIFGDLSRENRRFLAMYIKIGDPQNEFSQSVSDVSQLDRGGSSQSASRNRVGHSIDATTNRYENSSIGTMLQVPVVPNKSKGNKTKIHVAHSVELKQNENANINGRYEDIKSRSLRGSMPLQTPDTGRPLQNIIESQHSIDNPLHSQEDVLEDMPETIVPNDQNTSPRRPPKLNSGTLNTRSPSQYDENEWK